MGVIVRARGAQDVPMQGGGGGGGRTQGAHRGRLASMTMQH